MQSQEFTKETHMEIQKYFKKRFRLSDNHYGLGTRAYNHPGPGVSYPEKWVQIESLCRVVKLDF